MELQKQLRATSQQVSVPSRGYLYLNFIYVLWYDNLFSVSVPSRGYLYLNTLQVVTDINGYNGFRPLSGISISKFVCLQCIMYT